MADRTAATIRKPRSDAVRNRERVLEAAKSVFSAGGPDASLEAVARHAGVGIGTLYRHFPTREALFEAVYRREVEQLTDLAEQLKSESSPVEALRRFDRLCVLDDLVLIVLLRIGRNLCLSFGSFEVELSLLSGSSFLFFQSLYLSLERSLLLFKPSIWPESCSGLMTTPASAACTL